MTDAAVAAGPAQPQREPPLPLPSAADDNGALARVLPEHTDRLDWSLSHTSAAADTGAVVYHYVFRHSGRTLRLDSRGRVYGRDTEGVIRLFGRGGPLALHVAINMVFDGFDDCRPSRIVLPRRG